MTTDMDRPVEDTQPGTTDGLAPRDAAEWFLALDEHPADPHLRARFDTWLAAEAMHRQEWEEVLRTYRVAGMAEPTLRHRWGAFAARRTAARRTGAIADSSAREVQRRRFIGSGFLRPRYLVLAFATTCVALAFAPALELRVKADHITATAESRAITLAEGSTIRLAPQSAIAVVLTAGERRVDLLKGEALFEVTPDASRPFRVSAGGVETTVLGTVFDVRRHQEGVDVGVRHGHVRVGYAAPANPVSQELRDGDRLRVAWTGATARDTAPPEYIAAWSRGKVIARGDIVADVVDAIRPYFKGYIVVSGDRLARQPLTGVYDLGNPIAAVQAVAGAQGATVRRVSPWFLLISE